MKFVPLSIFLALVLASTSASAYKWEISENSSINLAVLLQPQLQMSEDKAPSGDAYSKDFFLRRIRLLAYGAVNKNLTYFVETDQPNFGKDGNFEGQFFIQDAFMAYRFMEEFQLAAGLILLPFTRHNFQSAAALSGLDYHVNMIKLGGNHKVWRDVGLQAYGWALGEKLHYRLGVFGGQQGAKDLGVDRDGEPLVANPDDLPRITGHVRYNILGKEKDFFAKGIYFSETPIVSVGVGVDFVPDAIVAEVATATKKAELGAQLGIAADVFAEYPLNADNEVLFQATYFQYDAGEKAVGTGSGFLAEAGYRWKWLHPVIGYDMFMSDEDDWDYTAMRFGVNFWGNKHLTNLKAEFAMITDQKGDKDAKAKNQFTLQTQFFW